MDQNVAIRQEMKTLGLSFIRPMTPTSWWRRLMGRDNFSIGELNKSWDVYETAQLVNASLERDFPILDMGAFGSEILLVLSAMGFTHLHGIDINRQVEQMPFNDTIHFRTGNFYQTSYADESFSAITSISAIEHGCDINHLLREVARLLRPDGLFISSFDYWPDKIPTEDIKMFDMSWIIFSREEVEQLIAIARTHGLVPCGPLDFNAVEKPISCVGKDYTFAWLALQKR